MPDRFSEYPQRVHASTQRPGTVYVRKPGYYAEHDRQPDSSAPGAELTLSDGAIAVFHGEPDEEGLLLRADALSPVYELQPGGSPFVPTGLVFIRFLGGTDVDSRREDIEQTGYEVAHTLPYASNAAWLRAKSRRIADALTGIPKLEALSGIENVEPQMLMESVPRT